MESKIDVTDRLRREGRWEEASLFRDETRRQLRSDGKSKNEASEAAWEAMIEKFPPLGEDTNSNGEPDETEQSDADIDELIARTDGNEPDLVNDILWVYKNVQNTGARATDAPSLGAWSMLSWARKTPKRFFEQLLPKALAVQEKQEAVEVQADYEHIGGERVLKMLHDMRIRAETQSSG